MMLRKFLTTALFGGVLALSLYSCKKNDQIDKIIAPPEAARFNAPSLNVSYFVNNTTGATYKIPVSFSTPSSQERIVSVTYISRTAVKGEQFNGPDFIKVPAGKILDTITISGLMSGFATPGRRDTLYVKLTNPDTINKKGTFRLIMQKQCPVVLNDLLGTYSRTNEVYGTSPYGPYITTVSSVTPLTATTGKIKVTNIWDFGWNPIEFTLDWTDPINTKVTLVQQSGIADAGTITAAYDGEDVSVRPFAGQVGTFSMCDQTITLRMQLGVTGIGWFANLYTVNMAR
jgi:hypothetical protein